MTIDRAIEVLATKQSILVFTGAGISTESGIPDFRGPDGVWTRVDPAEFTLDRYLTNAATRRRSWEMRSGSGILDARHNDGHRAITDLWNTGRMLACVTQNIDGLHTAAGMPPDAVIELHGNARTARCIECSASLPTSDVLVRFEAGEDDPRCRSCHGIIKVDVVFFGEDMPRRAMTRAIAVAAGCDAVIAVGSTLSVYPAAQVPIIAVESGAPLVIINQGPTELDHLATTCVNDSAGASLRTIVDALND